MGGAATLEQNDSAGAKRMEPKIKPILKNCVEIGIRIGQTIAALQAVGRMPPGKLRVSMTTMLEQKLGRLAVQAQLRTLLR
jgi:hypothetical protein